MDFFDTSEEDLKVPEKLTFEDNEIVKFQCIDQRQDLQKGNLSLKCNVLSGKHSGKQTTIYLDSRDNEASKKVKQQFLLAFWTADEVKTKACKPARLVGRTFTAKSKVRESKQTKGQFFQNWQEFKDLGTDGQSAPQPSTAPQHAPNVAPPSGAAPAQSAAQRTTF